MDATEKTELADRLAPLLSIQMLGPTIGTAVTKIEKSAGCINRKAIGYIYGFIDCALQCRGEDISNLDVGLPIVFHAMRKLFPGHEQAYIDFLMSHMEDEVTVLGMMAGGQEYQEFLHDKRASWGLAKILREPSSS
jgi:hypothetical protein